MFPLLNLKFTDLNLRKHLIKFVQNNYLNERYFTVNSRNYDRFYCNLLHHNDLHFLEEVKLLRNNAYKQINIDFFEEEPVFGIFLGLNLEGGSVHKHTDPTQNGYTHTRINFLLSKPYEGGNPIINCKIYEIDEGCSWINLASKWEHNSTPVRGNKPRIVLSLGSLVKTEIIDNLNITL